MPVFDQIISSPLSRCRQLANAAAYEYAKPHGGESVKDLRLRASKMLQSLDNKQRTLLVTHAGFIRAALTMLYASHDDRNDALKDERDVSVGYGEFVEYRVSPMIVE